MVFISLRRDERRERSDAAGKCVCTGMASCPRGLRRWLNANSGHLGGARSEMNTLLPADDRIVRR